MQDNQQERSLVQLINRRIVSVAITALTIVIVTTIVGLFARSHWLADIVTNLRMQQVIGLVGIAVVLTIGRKWKWLLCTGVLLCIHGSWFSGALVRGISNNPQQSQNQPELVVMTANVLTSNRQYDAILAQIESADADVFAILELGTPLHERLEKELATSYPHRVTIPQDLGNFGIGLYSRHPLSDIDRFATNIQSIESIAATVKRGSNSYRIIATHPLPPMGEEKFRSRNEHLQILADRVSKLHSSNPDLSAIVMGDLNLTPWSPFFAHFESQSGLTLAATNNDIVPTWYTKPMFPFGLVLDHVLISDDLRCLHREIGPDIGSDHRAVIVTVSGNQTQ